MNLSHRSHPRAEQLELLNQAIEGNVIVYMETGRGKTLIAVLLIDYLLTRRPDARKIIFIANLVTLVEQQSQYICDNISQKCRIGKYHGQQGAGIDFWDLSKWENEYASHDVLVMTAQIFLDNLRHAYIKMNDVSLIVFDEAHHARKNQPYNCIMKEFYFQTPCLQRPKILGLTASPVHAGCKKVQSDEKLAKLWRELEANLDCVIISPPAVAVDNADVIMAKPKEYEHFFEPSESSQSLFAFVKVDFDIQKGFYSRDSINYVYTALGPWCALQVVTRLRDSMRCKVSLFRPAGFQDHLRLLEQLVAVLHHELSVDNDFSSEDSKEMRGEKAAEMVGDATVNREKTDDSMFSFPTAMAHVSGQAWDLLAILQSYAITNEQQHQLLCSLVFVQRRYTADALARLINVCFFSSHGKVLTMLQNHIRTRVGGSRGGGTGSSGTKIGEVLGAEVVMQAEALVGAERLYSSAVDPQCGKQRAHKGADKLGLHECLPRTQAGGATDTIARLKRGELQVLVATAVAEEGIDIQSCQLVIRFNPLQTITSYIQSRGRARHPKAEYVVMLERENAGEESSFFQLKRCEENMKILGSTQDASPRICEQGVRSVDPSHQYVVPSTGAAMSLQSAVCMVHQYCDLLPRDPYCSNQPKFQLELGDVSLLADGGEGAAADGKDCGDPHIAQQLSIIPSEREDVGMVTMDHDEEEEGEGEEECNRCYRVTLRLPVNSNSTVKIVRGPWSHVKALAKQQVCLQACKLLHESGGLDDHLLPNFAHKTRLVVEQGDQGMTMRSKERSYLPLYLCQEWPTDLPQLTDGLDAIELYAYVILDDDAFGLMDGSGSFETESTESFVTTRPHYVLLSYHELPSATAVPYCSTGRSSSSSSKAQNNAQGNAQGNAAAAAGAAATEVSRREIRWSFVERVALTAAQLKQIETYTAMVLSAVLPARRSAQLWTGPAVPPPLLLSPLNKLRDVFPMQSNLSPLTSSLTSPLSSSLTSSLSSSLSPSLLTSSPLPPSAQSPIRTPFMEGAITPSLNPCTDSSPLRSFPSGDLGQGWTPEAHTQSASVSSIDLLVDEHDWGPLQQWRRHNSKHGRQCKQCMTLQWYGRAFGTIKYPAYDRSIDGHCPAKNEVRQAESQDSPSLPVRPSQALLPLPPLLDWAEIQRMLASAVEFLAGEASLLRVYKAAGLAGLRELIESAITTDPTSGNRRREIIDVCEVPDLRLVDIVCNRRIKGAQLNFSAADDVPVPVPAPVVHPYLEGAALIESTVTVHSLMEGRGGKYVPEGSSTSPVDAVGASIRSRANGAISLPTSLCPPVRPPVSVPILILTKKAVNSEAVEGAHILDNALRATAKKKKMRDSLASSESDYSSDASSFYPPPKRSTAAAAPGTSHVCAQVTTSAVDRRAEVPFIGPLSATSTSPEGDMTVDGHDPRKAVAALTNYQEKSLGRRWSLVVPERGDAMYE